jgi:P27 family predicted phage terminase small subunit
MTFLNTRLPPNLNIVKNVRKKSTESKTANLMPNYLGNPDEWDKAAFFESTKQFLLKKNGVLDIADIQLIEMLASQIEIYFASVCELKTAGLIINFNNGVTLGPNPYMNIADKALNRIVQVMKELELSPKARAGYRSNYEISPELKRLIEGP